MLKIVFLLRLLLENGRLCCSFRLNKYLNISKHYYINVKIVFTRSGENPFFSQDKTISMLIIYTSK